VTEDEAKKKVCPLIGLLAMTTLHAALKAVALDLPEESKKNLEDATSDVDANCLGPGCMMWKPGQDGSGGDCGLKR